MEIAVMIYVRIPAPTPADIARCLHRDQRLLRDGAVVAMDQVGSLNDLRVGWFYRRSQSLSDALECLSLRPL